MYGRKSSAAQLNESTLFANKVKTQLSSPFANITLKQKLPGPAAYFPRSPPTVEFSRTMQQGKRLSVVKKFKGAVHMAQEDEQKYAHFESNKK